MELYQLLGLTFLSVALVTILALIVLGRRFDPMIERMRSVARSKSDAAGDSGLATRTGQGEKEGRSFAEKLIAIGGVFSKRNKEFYSKLRLSMLQAGYYRENSVRIFMSLRIWAAVLFLIACIIPWLILGETVPPEFLGLLLPLPLLGYFLPSIILRSRIRHRQGEIAMGLPDALDFLVVCVEAGLGLNAALIRVGQELQLRCKALGEELILVNQEMRAGVSRENALRNLSTRSPIEDLRILVGSLILADKLGSSISDTLRAQANSLRIRVRQRVEEKAAQAGIKMLFPLVFFILPALFIVIMGPGVILTLNTMVK